MPSSMTEVPMKLFYEDLVMETIVFSSSDVVCDSAPVSRRDRKYAEWEKKQRLEALEEEYDEIDDMEDADF
ncbi:MAG: hypothetical protein IKT14_06615 [Clostridiales bacterium]|nr:hypothetical protein [Clostridiales bacterium]